jgi:hypothetical protein
MVVFGISTFMHAKIVVGALLQRDRERESEREVLLTITK